MAKFVKKSKCEFIDGYICKNNTILDIDPNVREYLNVLETKLQQVRYLNAQPEATSVPTMEGFERKSILDVTGPEFVPLTPIMNKKIEESLGYIREVNTSNELNKVNEMIGKYAHVLAGGVVVVVMQAAGVGEMCSGQAHFRTLFVHELYKCLFRAGDHICQT